MRRASPSLLVLSCFLLLLAGCGEDSVLDPGDGMQDPPFAPPTSETELMTMFRTAYTDMDVDLYGDLLSDDFLFFFIHADISWDRTEDLISTMNMFSGEAVTNSQGELTKAITSIDVDQLILVEDWQDVDASHPQFGDMEGARTALYQLRFVLHHNEGTITIESDQIFYAAPTTADGETTWALLGQADLNKANENFTFSNVKALFR